MIKKKLDKWYTWLEVFKKPFINVNQRSCHRFGRVNGMILEIGFSKKESLIKDILSVRLFKLMI